MLKCIIAFNFITSIIFLGYLSHYFDYEYKEPSAEIVVNVHDDQIGLYLYASNDGYDFVSQPLEVGYFTADFYRNNYNNYLYDKNLSREENIFKFIGTFLVLDSEYVNYQKVVFDGLWSVLNHKMLAMLANVRECGDYSSNIELFPPKVIIIYDCYEGVTM